ncbi:MAG TPA: hypothetical protein VGG63_10415 [Steroidobacteraceae bacterium]
MTKSPLLPIALLPVFAIAAAGCASHQPPAALSAQLTVMQEANDLGYTTPKVVNGETLYCQPEEVTGSMVPKLACLNADEVTAQVRVQGDLLLFLKSPPNATPNPKLPPAAAQASPLRGGLLAWL